jgi:DNA-binding transcriptional ArsR family regulator
MLHDSSDLDRLFYVLSDPTRRAMLLRLTMEHQNIGALAAPFDMTFPAASKHVKVLESAGLLSREIIGRKHVLQIKPMPLDAVNEWLVFYQAICMRQALSKKTPDFENECQVRDNQTIFS